MNELDLIIKKLSQVDNYLVPYESCQEIINSLSIKVNFPIILVGGTNGKGSVCSYISSILIAGGYKVGLYTSPHLLIYNERIKINNEDIPSKKLLNILDEIISLNINLGIFKTFTIATMKYFIEQNIDIAVIEVGVGGGKDITNLFEPLISVITNVSLDHCDTLGNNIEDIAQIKSQIYRTNKIAIYGDLTPPKSLINYAKKINSKLMILNQNFGYQINDNSMSIWVADSFFHCIPLPYLRGKEQFENVTTAIAVIKYLPHDFHIALQNIKEGVIKTRLKGRFQVIPGELEMIMDVAHNPSAVNKLISNVSSLITKRENIAVFGIAFDKDYTEIINICKNHFTLWYISKLSTNKGLDVKLIYELLILKGYSKDKIILCDSIKEAFIQAYDFANNFKSRYRIIGFGSFDVVKSCLTTLKEMSY